MRVFLDNCLSPVLASTLRGFLDHLGHSASHIRDLPCGRDATDIQWIGYLRSTGDEWLIVTSDNRIRRNKAERQAYRQAGLGGFVLAAAYQKMPINQQAALILWRWPDMEKLTSLTAPPFLYELPANRQSRITQLTF